MKPITRGSKLFAVLLIIGIVCGALSSIPAIEKSNYLSELASMKAQVLIAVFFQFAMAFVYTCIAIVMYPTLEAYSKKMAMGYLGFRLIGSMFLFVGIVSLLLLLSVSQRYVEAGQADLSYLQTIGDMVREGRDWFNHIVMFLPWHTGGLLLYYALLKMRIVPAWLSVWGLIGSALTLLATFLLMFDQLNIVSYAYFLLNTPLALAEISLALFLLIKGFTPVPHNVKIKEAAQ